MLALIIGLIGIGVTVALHAIATSIIVSVLKSRGGAFRKRLGRFGRPLLLGIIATFLATKHYVDIVLWAMAYWWFTERGFFDDFESAVYFSSITYTALGYGDIVLTGSWRLLCGIQAMNGILLFGWSTAILFVLVQRLWADDYQSFE